MNGRFRRLQPLLGYFGAALLAFAAFGPVANSRFFAERTFFAGNWGAGVIFIAAALLAGVLTYRRKFDWLWLAALSGLAVCLLTLLEIVLFSDEGRAQFAGVPLGIAFVDFADTYWGSLRFGWGLWSAFCGSILLVLAIMFSMAETRLRLLGLSHNKIYDVLIALPLILFYTRGVFDQLPILTYRFDELRDGTASVSGTLQFIAVCSSILFSLLLIVLVFVRSVPVGKAQTIMPRLIAVLGTFAVTSILYMPAIALPLWLQVVAVGLIILGNVLSVVVLFKLGRAFSIMPEARKLITTGPYGIVRHPLYFAEEFAIIGLLIQFASPFALGLGIAHATLQYMRTVYEERVLEQTFPEYDRYRSQTRWRFIPGVI